MMVAGVQPAYPGQLPFSSGFEKAISTEYKMARSCFWGQVKEYIACKQPSKVDKIPSKVAW